MSWWRRETARPDRPIPNMENAIAFLVTEDGELQPTRWRKPSVPKPTDMPGYLMVEESNGYRYVMPEGSFRLAPRGAVQRLTVTGWCDVDEPAPVTP